MNPVITANMGDLYHDGPDFTEITSGFLAQVDVKRTIATKGKKIFFIVSGFGLSVLRIA
jgi:hypothetical protein